MGLKIEALRWLFRRPVTENYPKQKKEPYPLFRGRIVYHPKTCIGCRLCERNCPTKAITFHEKGKIEFDMGKCILCGLCRDVCPTKPKSISFSREFEYASTRKENLKNRIS